MIQHLSDIKNYSNIAVLKDSYINDHHERVLFYVGKFVKHLCLEPNLQKLTCSAAAVHDIGKINIPNSILLKPDKLTPEEFELIKLHPVIGYDLLINKDENIARIVLYHHERWDGTGYPKGLSENNIPLPSRLIALADTYDAITSDRPYKKAINKRKALAEIIRCAGTQFDPGLVKEFIKVF